LGSNEWSGICLGNVLVMATRCYIGIKMAVDEFKSIYCHNDGYPMHVGKMLKEHYSDRSVAESLISLGDMKRLAESIETSVFYRRDRGETEYVDTEIRTMEEMDEAYTYIFDNEWLCAGRSGVWLSIDAAIALQVAGG